MGQSPVLESIYSKHSTIVFRFSCQFQPFSSGWSLQKVRLSWLKSYDRRLVRAVACWYDRLDRWEDDPALELICRNCSTTLLAFHLRTLLHCKVCCRKVEGGSTSLYSQVWMQWRDLEIGVDLTALVRSRRRLSKPSDG